MHRDPTLRRRNALVIPGVLLTLFSLEGMAYATWLRPDNVECGDGSLVVFAYACRRVGLLLLAPLVLGVILTIVGALQRSKNPCHPGHGTVAATGLAILITGFLVPAAATLGLYGMEDPNDPFVFTYDGVQYGQVALLTLLSGIMALALIPYLALYIGTARPRACCRAKNCFEPCFCDEKVAGAPAAPDNAYVVDAPWSGPTGTTPLPPAPLAPPPVPPAPAKAPVVEHDPWPAPVTHQEPEPTPSPRMASLAPPVAPAPLMPEVAEPEVEELPEEPDEPKASKAKPAAKSASAKKSKLTKKQLAQRKYAASMRGIRGRAEKASGGKGPIAKRGPATKLRRDLGLKDGK